MVDRERRLVLGEEAEDYDDVRRTVAYRW